MRAAKIIFSSLSLLFLLGFFQIDVASAVVTAPVNATSLDAPARIYIPKISKAAPVVPVGIAPAGNIDVPHNYVQAGWYALGAAPGQVGSAIIDGHVDNGASIPGVFKRLRELTVGDDIYVTNKAGRTLHFKVTAADIYARNAPSTPIFSSSGVPLLRVITCYGTFIPKAGTYDRRLVVTAELVG
jgi:sortase (surface protein transpeptidase)